MKNRHYYLEIFLAAIFASTGEILPSTTTPLMISVTPFKSVICKGSSKKLNVRQHKNVTDLKQNMLVRKGEYSGYFTRIL